MSARPAEATRMYPRLLKCTLEVENSRAYWRHRSGGAPVSTQRAFDEYWFGAKSPARQPETCRQLLKGCKLLGRPTVAECRVP